MRQIFLVEGVLAEKREKPFNKSTFYTATLEFMGGEMQIDCTRDQFRELAEGRAYRFEGTIRQRSFKNYLNVQRVTDITEKTDQQTAATTTGNGSAASKPASVPAAAGTR